MTREHSNLKQLITRSLGYCCLWAFFSLYRKPGQIADRLGCTKNAVKYRKNQFLDGKLKCEQCTNCMKSSLRRLRGERR